mmetsp:Transcript_108248/g.221015  ORF Transcript_108248/g.221015 Transcript_108248/m.221015 type:complete len:92 (+) Transcript_108248:526-801(+)
MGKAQGVEKSKEVTVVLWQKMATFLRICVPKSAEIVTNTILDLLQEHLVQDGLRWGLILMVKQCPTCQVYILYPCLQMELELLLVLHTIMA